MRVLLTSTSGRGHIGPLLPLAQALREQGDEVRWAASPRACEVIASAGIDAVPAGIEEPVPSPLREPPPHIAALPPSERPDHVFAILFGPLRARPMLADLLPLAREWQPELIVAEQAELAAPIAAALLEVPNVTHGFGPLLPEARVARARESMAPLWREHGLAPRPYAGTYDHCYLDPYPASMRHGTGDHVGRIEPIRPVEPLARDPRADPIVYVTFGTVVNDDAELFRASTTAAAATGLQVVVTLGEHGDPALLGEQPAHVRVERFIPQATVLPHCAAVVSHGGSGTFLAAVGAGVPQVVIPQAADQFLNAQAGERAGVSIAVPLPAATADAIEAALRRVLGDPGFATAAGRVRDEIAAMPPAAAVAARLRKLSS